MVSHRLCLYAPGTLKIGLGWRYTGGSCRHKAIFFKALVKGDHTWRSRLRFLPQTEGWVREVEGKPCDYVSMEFNTGVFQEGTDDL